jgi:rare lipoprotein A
MGRINRWAALALAGMVGAAPIAATAAGPRHHHRHHHLPKVQKGKASYYRAPGKTTASGKPMKPHALTAASKTLPLGTKAKVVNAETGRAVNVTVTDRGPYAKGRIIDLSPKAAEKLGMKDDGVAPVKVKPIAPPPEAKGGKSR